MKNSVTDLTADEFKLRVKIFKKKMKNHFSTRRILRMYQLADVFIDDIRGQINISCTKGCSHCCYQPVTVVPREFAFIKKYVGQKSIEFDKDQLEIQRMVEWDKATELRHRKCLFLKDDVCQIYDVRPMSCRTLLTVSDPEKCRMDTNFGGEVGYVDRGIFLAIQHAAFPISKFGFLHELLWGTLNQSELRWFDYMDKKFNGHKKD